MLTFDPAERISAADALKHEFFVDKSTNNVMSSVDVVLAISDIEAGVSALALEPDEVR